MFSQHNGAIAVAAAVLMLRRREHARKLRYSPRTRLLSIGKAAELDLDQLGQPFRPSKSDTALVPDDERLPDEGLWARTGVDYGPKRDVLNTGKSKLVVVFVGKPGCGKTYYARKLTRFLCYAHFAARVFTYATVRGEMYGRYQPPGFFSTQNAAGVEKREAVCRRALDDAMAYLEQGGEIAVLDGTNSRRTRRDMIRQRVEHSAQGQALGAHLLWVECICDDATIMEAQLRNKVSGPEYSGFSSESEARADFQRRLDHYGANYQTIADEEDGQSIQIFDCGRKSVLRNIHGWLQTRIVSFLNNVHTVPKRIFLTRHGESQYNTKGLIGGDPGLSEEGKKYASVLAQWMQELEQSSKGSSGDISKLQIWSSTMNRALQTAGQTAEELVPKRRVVRWRCLQEIDVGICDSLTYKQVQERWPEEFEARTKDKLRYRYPRGESYLDIIERLEPVIMALESEREPVMVVAHQAVHRCLYAYFRNIPPHEVPFISIPLHEVIEIIPQAYGCTEKRHKLMEVNPKSEVSQKHCVARK